MLKKLSTKFPLLLHRPNMALSTKLLTRSFSTLNTSKKAELHDEFDKAVVFDESAFDLSEAGLPRGTGDVTISKPHVLVDLFSRAPLKPGEYQFSSVGKARVHKYLAVQDNTPSAEELRACSPSQVVDLLTSPAAHALSWSSNFNGGSTLFKIDGDEALFHLVRRSLEKVPWGGYDPVIAKDLRNLSDREDTCVVNASTILPGLDWSTAFTMEDLSTTGELPDWVLNCFTAYTQYELAYGGNSHAVDGQVIHGRLVMRKPKLKVIDFRFGMGGGFMPILSGMGNNWVAEVMWQKQLAGMRENILNLKALQVVKSIRQRLKDQQAGAKLDVLFRNGVLDLGETPQELGPILGPFNTAGGAYRRAQSLLITALQGNEGDSFGTFKNKGR